MTPIYGLPPKRLSVTDRAIKKGSHNEQGTQGLERCSQVRRAEKPSVTMLERHYSKLVATMAAERLA